jgi:hypothetical protein
MGFSQKKTTAIKTPEKTANTKLNSPAKTNTDQKKDISVPKNSKSDISLDIQKNNVVEENPSFDAEMAIATVLKFYEKIQAIEHDMEEKKILILKDATMKSDERLEKVQEIERKKTATIMETCGEKAYEIYKKTMAL